jgi:hypothetical protein
VAGDKGQRERCGVERRDLAGEAAKPRPFDAGEEEYECD